MTRMETVSVRSDRDSVAAGDDGVSHAHQRDVPVGTSLSELIELASPGIRAPGWSWVAVVDGRPSAVWSVDHGAQLLVPEQPVGAEGPREVYFRYFLQIDPAWLHARLEAGSAADRHSLSKAFAPIAAERAEAEARRRERELAEKLVPDELVQGFVRLGASVDLHSDRMLRLEVRGRKWSLRLTDTMTQVDTPDGPSVVSARPVEVAARLALVAVGEEVCGALGLDPLPAGTRRWRLRRGPSLRAMHSGVDGEQRWSTQREPVQQLRGQRAVRWFHYAQARSTTELVRLLTRDVPTI